MTMAALAAVLRLYNDPDRLADRLPTLRWLTRSPDELAINAKPIAEALCNSIETNAIIEIVDCESQIGSGALPTRTVPSVGISCAPPATTASPGNWLMALAASFRRLPTPVIGRIRDGCFVLDLRCLDDIDGFILNLHHLDLAQ